MKIFKSDIIVKQLTTAELTALEADFFQYKNTGIPPTTFGRDVLYDHHNTLPSLKIEEVRHLHLAKPDTPWPNNKMVYYKTSDIHLIYCHGALQDDAFLLMSILQPNAHSLATDKTIMMKLGMMAEKFRLQY